VDVYLVPSLQSFAWWCSQGAVDVKASTDSSSALSFLSSLSSGSIIFQTVIYEGLKSITFALLILIGGVFLEQYQPV